MNRLATEKSPYLQMHRSNPVDWYPWGQEARDAAKKADKPIFLSIGYSSCHWCHVIAHESFEDESIAAVLNAEYIPVKVDKEERPDVDAVYMDAVQLATGAGGWPMTVLTTPDGAPFFAATYLPKEARGGMPGLKPLLARAASLWKSDRDGVLRTAESFASQMRALANREAPPGVPTEELTARAYRAYRASYDEEWGGFGRAPKFPSAHNLLFLLAHFELTGETQALEMVERTLRAMFRGGIFDHIGGGFSRYSIDRKWLVPHFEKMLYDNALLIWAYAETWRITQNPFYRQVAERTADYVLRELTGAEGEFFCAQDADSAGKEGAYYVFTRTELHDLLGEADGARFCETYGVTESGNFEGKSIPNLIGNPRYMEAEDALQSLRERVYAYRKARLPLGLDDKALLSWNALMITALCRASKALDRPDYLEAARRAERFLLTHLTRDGGRLILRYRDGEAKGEGVQADYAYYALALMALYEATGDAACLARAEQTARALLERFGDDARGGFYLYAKDAEALVTRPKETWDAAMPSGNSCAALALEQLAEHTGKDEWRRAADRQLRFIAGAADEQPTGHGFALYAISRALAN